MSNELTFALIGGAIGIVAGSVPVILTTILSNRRRVKSIKSIALAEITAIKEKAERYLADESNREELAASTPLLTSIASEFGFLSHSEAIALRRTITLDMEMRASANIEKARLTIDACDAALLLFGK